MHDNLATPVTVLAYNTFDGFGDPSRADGLINFVISQSPDIAFFSEAYESSADVTRVIERFRNEGYTCVSAPYNDADKRRDKHNFLGLIRLPGLVSAHRYATRTGMSGTFPAGNRTLAIIGLHADDRSEEGRLVQVGAIPAVSGPTMMMGDLNAMHRDEPISRVMRAFGPIARRLPSIEPDAIAVKQPLIPRVGNLARRFNGMAQGRTLDALAAKGLYDADPLHAPTIHGIAQLDHVLVTPDITVTDFRVHTAVSLSDHKPVTATLWV